MACEQPRTTESFVVNETRRRREERKQESDELISPPREDEGILSKLSSVSFPPIQKIKDLAWNVVPFEALPNWLQDNEYLHNCHRPPMNSFQGCIKSMFRMHTETWNIWTHLLGFIFFAILTSGVYCFRDYITHLFEANVNLDDLPMEEKFVMFAFFLGAMVCLFFSFSFHLLCNHSEKVHYVVSRLDYGGIAFLILGSSIPAYYYAFYCTTVSKYVHIAICTVLGMSCVVASLWQKFGTKKYRPLRFAIFVLFGLYGFVPGAHIWLTIVPLTHPYPTLAFGLILMAVLYLVGAGIYVLRVPERFFPGKCDVWAHSHQIFHVCVVVAALVHYDTLLSMVKYRLDVGSDCIETLVVSGLAG